MVSMSGAARQARRGRRAAPRRSWLLLHLTWVFDRVESCELDIVELAVLLLDFADVDVLHDIAGVRINGDRPARAFPRQALHGRDQCIAIGLATGLLQCLINEMHAVVAA